MTEDVKKFLKFACEDDELSGKLSEHYQTKGDGISLDFVIKLADEHGYKLQREDFAVEGSELDEDTLTAVAGGKVILNLSNFPGRTHFGSDL